MTFDQAVGAVGVFILLLAYVSNVTGRFDAGSKLYQGMNAAGAGLACLASWLIDYLPFVILEGVWCAVAVVSLTAMALHGESRNRSGGFS